MLKPENKKQNAAREWSHDDSHEELKVINPRFLVELHCPDCGAFADIDCDVNFIC